MQITKPTRYKINIFCEIQIPNTRISVICNLHLKDSLNSLLINSVSRAWTFWEFVLCRMKPNPFSIEVMRLAAGRVCGRPSSIHRTLHVGFIYLLKYNFNRSVTFSQTIFTDFLWRYHQNIARKRVFFQRIPKAWSSKV